MFVCNTLFMRALASSDSSVILSTTFQLYLFVSNSQRRILTRCFIYTTMNNSSSTDMQNKFVFQDWIVRHYHFPAPILGVNGAPETCSYKLWLANERHYGSISGFFIIISVVMVSTKKYSFKKYNLTDL